MAKKQGFGCKSAESLACFRQIRFSPDTVCSVSFSEQHRLLTFKVQAKTSGDPMPGSFLYLKFLFFFLEYLVK